MRSTILLCILLNGWFVGVHSQSTQTSMNRIDPANFDSLIDSAESTNQNPDTLISICQIILSSTDETDLYPRVRAHEAMAMGYYNQNRFQSAAAQFEKALNIYITISDSAGIARVYNRLGSCHFRLLNYPQAIAALNQALKIRERIGDKLLIASTLNNLAVCFQSASLFDKAVEVQSQSLLLYREAGDIVGQVYSLNNLGTIFTSTNRYQEALEKFNEILELREKLNDTSSIASTLGNMGIVHQKMGNIANAIKCFQQSAEIFEKNNDALGLASMFSNLAELYLIANDNKKAYLFISKSIKLSSGDTLNAIVLNNTKILSDYYYASGDFLKSRELLAKYAELKEQFFSHEVSNRIAELSLMYNLEKNEKERQVLETELELGRIRTQKSRYIYILLIFSIFITLSHLGYYVVMARKIRKKNQRIEQANSELNHMNTHLEAIVNARTRDLLLALIKAEESDKLKSAFLANMSHEVRTPLNGLLGFARLLDDDKLQPHIRRQYIDIMTLRGNNLTRTINDIISISQIEVGQLEIKMCSCSINKLLSNLFTLFDTEGIGRRKGGVKLNLIKTLSDSRSNIITDPIRLEQILFNLIDNALKYTHEGIVEFGYQLDNSNTLKFFVKDTGSGIPTDQHSKVFTRFHKFNNSNGSGLGLSICKGLVELLDGKIWFDTKPNEGTTFFFTIPYVTAGDSSPFYTSNLLLSNQKLDLSGKVILVVEDDLISFQLIEALLKDSKVKLIHVKNGEDAVEVCEFTPIIDLVLMDMRLPFISGYEATTQIRKKNPNLKIIAQTANVLSDDREKCIRVGCCDYVAKPIDPDEFVRIIGNHLLNPVTG